MEFQFFNIHFVLLSLACFVLKGVPGLLRNGIDSRFGQKARKSLSRFQTGLGAVCQVLAKQIEKFRKDIWQQQVKNKY
jgi:hypothetical protein